MKYYNLLDKNGKWCGISSIKEGLYTKQAIKPGLEEKAFFNGEEWVYEYPELKTVLRESIFSIVNYFPGGFYMGKIRPFNGTLIPKKSKEISVSFSKYNCINYLLYFLPLFLAMLHRPALFS